jgi:hypothetical protein
MRGTQIHCSTQCTLPSYIRTTCTLRKPAAGCVQAPKQSSTMWQARHTPQVLGQHNSTLGDGCCMHHVAGLMYARCTCAAVGQHYARCTATTVPGAVVQPSNLSITNHTYRHTALLCHCSLVSIQLLGTTLLQGQPASSPFNKPARHQQATTQPAMTVAALPVYGDQALRP